MIEPDAPDQAQARAYFERACQASEAGDFDRAIDAYIEGLRRAPDAVDGGHIGLRVLALRRLERAGAKPTEEEISQRLSSGQNPLERMLNAELLLAKDPEHLPYAEAVLRAAVAGGYTNTVKWMADLMFLANNNAKKPSVQVYILLKDSYEAAGLLERAVAAGRRAVRLKPGDQKLTEDLKQLTAKFAASSRRPAHAGRGQNTSAAQPIQNSVTSTDARSVSKVGNPNSTMDVSAKDGHYDMAAAKAFFEKARKAAESKNYDYAIEMYLDGLRYAPDALEEGHLPLVELGLQRRGRGGKRPSMMERVKRLRGKTPLEQMLNAEYLFAKDPDHLPYAETMLQAAVDGGYAKTAHWIANMIFQTNNALEKPSLSSYVLLKDCYVALGQLDKALAACQRALRMKPDDKDLTDECKNLAAELTMAKGNYRVDGDFRQSIRDQETQAKLYAQERIVKTEDYRVLAVQDARKAYEKDPELAKNIFDLATALADLETEESEDEAVRLLEDAYAAQKDFRFEERAGLLMIRQIQRKLRAARKLPAGPERKAQIERLSEALNATELEHYRLCMENYPTDPSFKYEYAVRLVKNKQYNEAIPLFQEAQKDPRRKIQAMSKVGYCFLMKGWYTDAIDVFSSTIDAYEIKDDAIAKELQYNLARAFEENGQKDEALEVYRKIAQIDFGYKDVGDRVDRLRAETARPDASAQPPGDAR
jgi:tetratricopeptide (TPR) repeat protein